MCLFKVWKINLRIYKNKSEILKVYMIAGRIYPWHGNAEARNSPSWTGNSKVSRWGHGVFAIWRFD